MKCRACRELFEDYVDAMLEAGEARAVEAHLAGCDSCSLHYRHSGYVIKTLEGMARKTAPSGFSKLVMVAIATEDISKAPRLEAAISDARDMKAASWLWAAAVIAALALFGLLIVVGGPVVKTATWLESLGTLTSSFAYVVEAGIEMTMSATSILAHWWRILQTVIDAAVAGRGVTIQAFVNIVLLVIVFAYASRRWSFKGLSGLI